MDKKSLKELNFKELMELDITNVSDYSFDEYHANNDRHPAVKSYCTLCEDKIGHICDDPNYKLCYISHGSCTEDFLKASNTVYDAADWNQAGVMFIMENPSKNYQIYEEEPITKDNNKTYDKWPAKQWYWIHNKQDITGFPEKFKGGEYGGLVASAIVTFKLANAYMTNMVKCGLNNVQDDTFKNTGSYNEKCMEMCYEAFLSKEIAAVNPKVIFVFGRNTYSWVEHLTKDLNIRIVNLPHPARQRQGFSNEFYQTLYFCLMAKWLFKENVISEEFYSKLMRLYAEA